MAFSFNDLIEINSLPTILLIIIGIFLSLVRRMDSAIKLESFGVPIALLAGFTGFLIGPFGPFPFLTHDVMDLCLELPTPLLTLVFATLMIGRPVPSLRVWKPVASQALLGLLLGFGQYVVGGIVVLFFLLPYLDVDPLMGCLLEVGFEGGHGAAAIMGASFGKLGFPEGLDLGLAMATVGLLASTLIGSGLLVIGRLNGWIANEIDLTQEEPSESEFSIHFGEQIRLLLTNLFLVGFAVLIGVELLQLIRFGSPYFGSIVEDVAMTFPVFPLALLGSFFVRVFLEKMNITKLVSPIFQREIGILSTDLLITTAMAGLNLPLLVNNWLPIVILSIAGLTWNLFGMLVFARLILREDWFERSIAEFGNATGVAASGLLLLRLADPRNKTNTLPIFSIKQLFLQPLLSGGLITVLAPLFINSYGLKGWTEICGLVTILLGSIAIYLPIINSKASA